MRPLSPALLFLLLAACGREALPPGTVEAPVQGVPILRAVERPPPGEFSFQGALTQGGLAIGRAPPGTVRVALGDEPVQLAPDRRFLVGFGRDAAPAATVTAHLVDGRRVEHRLAIAPRRYRVESIPGLSRRTDPDPEWLRMRAEERRRIEAGRAGRTSLMHWTERFIWPVTGRISGVYGSQRILGGVPGSPHAGVDIARPVGTTVVAPAGGVVTLASPPAFSLEGNMVFLDHGHGLHSIFLHLDRVDVAVGERVRQGEPIGTVGSTGRATGPHLHWAMNWGPVRVDPQLLVEPMPLALAGFPKVAPLQQVRR